MIIQTSSTVSLRERKEPKEMLSVTQDGKVRINYSSLNLISTCKRKAYYALSQRLTKNEESAPLIFGTAVHAALEVWYCAPRSERSPKGSSKCDDSQALMLAGHGPLNHGSCVRCASVYAFLQSAQSLSALDSSDKRSLSNGIDILGNYFDHYANDPFRVLSDQYGPVCERKFEFSLTDNITYFGTIDCVLINEQTGVIIVCDHKTTSVLGTEFYNRVRPNFQYVGYVMGAQRALGLTDATTFMSNGIQVAKTKFGLARQVTAVSEEDFDELRSAVDFAVMEYITCGKLASFPMTAPDPCSMYGGCAYRSVCEVPQALKKNVIESLYETARPSGESV